MLLRFKNNNKALLNEQKPYFEIFTDNVFFCNLQVYFEQTGTSKEENVSGRL